MLSATTKAFLQHMAQKTDKYTDELLVEMVETHFGETYQTWLDTKSLPLPHKTTHIVFNPQNLDEIYKILNYVVETATVYLPATLGCSLIVWDEVKQEFVMNVTTVPQQDAQVAVSRVRGSGGVTRWIIENQQAYIVNNIDKDPLGANPMLFEMGARSYMGVPVIGDGRIWGVLYATNDRTTSFTTQGINFIQNLATIAATALHKVNLTQELMFANDNLNAYTHTVAHDLKTPLQKIAHYLEAIKLENLELPAPLDTYTFYMNKVVYQTFEIIDELLVLAELKNSDSIVYQPLDTAKMIDEIQLRLQALIEKSEPQIITPPEWPVIVGHESWIKAIWTNFISNAIKYGDTPPIIELGYDHPQEDKIRCWVRDNGQGLTPEQQDQLFVTQTRFDQMEIEGHGFGLSIVKRIIDKMGGEIGVESTLGQGSLFFFMLPYIQEA